MKAQPMRAQCNKNRSLATGLMGLLCLVVVASFVVACGREGAAPVEQTVEPGERSDSKSVPVRVAPVQRGERALLIESAGRIGLKVEVSLSFKTQGVVESVSIDEGQRVRRDQLLAQLDPEEIEARQTQARAALEKAERDLRRTEELYGDDAATLEQLQNARTALEVARSDRQIADFNVRYSEIRAPVSGWLLRRVVEPGELVSPGQAVLVLGSADSGWVMRLGLADRDVVRVSLGDSARIELDAFPGHELEARVSQIAENADPRTGTFEVELELVGEGLIGTGVTLKSGFVGRAVIQPSRIREATAVPIEALIRADGREGLVYGVDAMDDRGWRPVPITIAGLVGSEVLVAKGLEGIDHVIVEGTQRLSIDARIEVLPPASAQSGGAGR